MGMIAAAVMVVGKVPYVISVVRGITRPSRTSWWTWTLLGTLSFAAYSFSGETATLWVHGFIVLGPLLVALLSIQHGAGGSSFLDRVVWFGCAVAVTVWAVTGSAAVTNYVNLVVDALATVLTVRKTLQFPRTEDLTGWMFSLCGYFLNLFAIREWSFFAASYPVYLLLMAASIVSAILIGKMRQKKNGSEAVVS